MKVLKLQISYHLLVSHIKLKDDQLVKQVKWQLVYR